MINQGSPSGFGDSLDSKILLPNLNCYDFYFFSVGYFLDFFLLTCNKSFVFLETHLQMNMTGPLRRLYR